ncbi:MAG TPA: DUF3854 domain-containing protein, partial [Rhizomicrobium sp.]|nr:DUF3854 domain-containing protein [Rhizomicrobium sp.]
MQAAAQQDLGRSGINAETADQCGLFDVEDASAIYPDFDAGPAVVIPYYHPDGELMTFQRDGETLPFCRVRYLQPPVTRPSGFGGAAKAQRYGQPGRSGTRAYFCPTVPWSDLMADAEEPVIITEGEKKGIAACAAGFPTIALGGVFNFTSGADDLMPELAEFQWSGRKVFICFDSDALNNPNILCAEARLVDELQRRRGAECFLIRLPQEGDNKVGLDDFLLQYGADAFKGLLKNAPSLGVLDAKVVGLNRHIAWIEKDGMVWDLEEQDWIRKDNLLSGSRFSSWKHIIPGGRTANGRTSDPKTVSIANEWLRHPHAARFGQLLFRPGGDRVITGDTGRPALNIWKGWQGAEPGNVEPFLELTEFLFAGLPEQHRELPLKLMAYKAQNPHVKVPLALVLLGPQGSGKTMWAEILRLAMMPYSAVVNPAAFVGQFQGWMEKSLLVVVNEAKGQDIEIASEELKALISDSRRDMNEKFRPARQIETFFQFIITSNKRAVGAFSADDRRMVVVNCPPPREESWYVDYLVPWKERGGPKHVLDYLLRLDLKGWKPPAHAPKTAEKVMAFQESLTMVQELAQEMQHSQESTIKLWLDKAVAWAEVTLAGNNTSAHPAALA